MPGITGWPQPAQKPVNRGGRFGSYLPGQIDMLPPLPACVVSTRPRRQRSAAQQRAIGDHRSLYSDQARYSGVIFAPNLCIFHEALLACQKRLGNREINIICSTAISTTGAE